MRMWSVAIEQILLTATLAVPALALLFKRRLLPRLGSIRLFLIYTMVVYALILLRVYLIEIRLDAELDAFDLNRDGSFSGGEITPAQETAMHRVVADAGRQFAPFTGVVLAPLCVALAFGLVKIVGMVRRLVQRIAGRT